MKKRVKKVKKKTKKKSHKPRKKKKLKSRKKAKKTKIIKKTKKQKKRREIKSQKRTRISRKIKKRKKTKKVKKKKKKTFYFRFRGCGKAISRTAAEGKEVPLYRKKEYLKREGLSVQRAEKKTGKGLSSVDGLEAVHMWFRGTVTALVARLYFSVSSPIVRRLPFE